MLDLGAFDTYNRSRRPARYVVVIVSEERRTLGR
jgi:hypothetical protein